MRRMTSSYADAGVRQPHPTASWHSFPTKTLFIGILHIVHIPVVAAVMWSFIFLREGHTGAGGIFLENSDLTVKGCHFFPEKGRIP